MTPQEQDLAALASRRDPRYDAATIAKFATDFGAQKPVVQGRTGSRIPKISDIKNAQLAFDQGYDAVEHNGRIIYNPKTITADDFDLITGGGSDSRLDPRYHAQGRGRVRLTPDGLTPEEAERRAQQVMENAQEERQFRRDLARAREMGGGLPANQWEFAGQVMRQNTPAGPGQAVMGNQLGAFTNYGAGLNSLYNSASGPYGQLQAAAAYIAPSKYDAQARRFEAAAQLAAEREKASAKRDIARQIVNSMGGVGRGVTGFETDYGAGASLAPVQTRRFRPQLQQMG